MFNEQERYPALVRWNAYYSLRIFQYLDPVLSDVLGHPGEPGLAYQERPSGSAGEAVDV